jgi:hypothetical protein
MELPPYLRKWKSTFWNYNAQNNFMSVVALAFDFRLQKQDESDLS